MKIKELCASERPRERLLSNGAGSLSNGELIAVLLRSGNRESSALELAQKLLKMCDGSLGRLSDMGAARLCSIPGISGGKASSIIASLELGRRFLMEESPFTKKPVVTSRYVFDIMLPVLKGLRHEECWVLLLNDSNYLLKKTKVTSGGGNSTVIDVRQVIRLALEHSASGIILVHNHPSGNPRPSDADIRQTDRLHEAANACGLELLDHIVVSDDSFFSFADDRMY